MKTRLTPHYISLVYEACLKSFWRRKALAKFLRQCDVSESLLQSWAPDESKRDVLDRLFLKLPRRCCTARRKSLTSLCRSESHPAQ